ncbi:heavy-metal-associated domain-containing protein [Hydrogenoanaerobacterium sp.]|uniref:heavy-metal-associated domain-containing protein n=1 Tax=Hydrogenoanaerobacterium sp. TaxID=2953763 RepID=UPI0037C10D35
MMKKTIKLQDLDCANCAAKIENAISKLEGVISCKVNFMGQKMILEAPDEKFDEVLTQAKKTANKIEADLVFLD